MRRLGLLLLTACSTLEQQSTDAGTTQPPVDAGHDAGAVVDSGAPDAGPIDAGPTHHAGTYANAMLDFPIVMRGVREHSVAYDAFNGGGYVIIFVDANRTAVPGFRLQAVNLRMSPMPTTGPELDVDDALAYEHYSGPNGLAAGPDGVFLAAFMGYRQVPPGGGYQNHVYGQFLRAHGDGRLERVGTNFAIGSGSANEQAPCVAWDETTRTYLVAWSSGREVPVRDDGYVMIARTVTPAGALGPELRLGENEHGQRRCAVRGGRGRFLVGWDDYLPTTGNNFDTAYRARIITNGALGPVLPATRIGLVIPDRTSVAYNERNDEWAVATALDRKIRVSILGPDGTARVVDRIAGMGPEGAGVPHIAWSRVTNSYLLTWHAWTSNDAAGIEVDPDGRAVGPLVQLNTVAPPNGTYETPVAASTRDGEFLVVMMKDFTRLNGTVFRSPATLP